MPAAYWRWAGSQPVDGTEFNRQSGWNSAQGEPLPEKYKIQAAPDNVDKANCFNESKNLHESLRYELKTNHHRANGAGVDKVRFEKLSRRLLIENKRQIVYERPITFRLQPASDGKQPARQNTNDERQDCGIAKSRGHAFQKE